MTRSRRVLLAAAAGVGLAALAHAASAGGFYSQEQSVRGLGGAHSGEAADSGADVLWWNPAAIAALPHGEVYAGLNYVLADAAVVDRGSTITRPFSPTTPVGGAPFSDPVGPGIAPNLAVAAPLDRRWSLGLSLTAPFGFITADPPQSWTRYQALKLHLIDLDLQPTLAFRAADWLDLGVGFDVNYGETRLTTALPNLSPLLPDGQSVVQGDGWDYGWVVGAEARPADRLTIGVSYRSQIEHRLPGTVTTQGLLGPLAAGNGVVRSVTRFTTPSIFTLGVRWRASDRWGFMAQMQRSGWAAFDTIHVDRPGAAPQPGVGARNTVSVAAGAEYAISQGWTLRGGVQFDPQAITHSAILADADRWIFAAGATWRPTARLKIDLAAAYVAFKTSPILSDATAYRGTPLATPVILDGQFSAQAPILSAGARWSF